jgi:hypothetical protein
MIRVNCATFEWGWEVVITHISGMKHTPISLERYRKSGPVDTPAEAIIDAVKNAHEFLRADLPETPEHS